MGLAISQRPPGRVSHKIEEKWTCPKCFNENPISTCPICMYCDELCDDFPDSKPYISSSKFWRCELCFSDNETNRQHCTKCGKQRLSQGKTKIMSDMRPMSVLVGDRRIMDESNAEKIFHEAIAFCKQNRVTFTDDQFRPSDHSLGFDDQRQMIQWLPITSIAPSTPLDNFRSWTIFNSPQPSDIHQGELGDCWLLAALTLITERPDMLQHILLTKNINREGVYLVRICYNGIWKTVLLDGYFPCTVHNTLAFSRGARCQLYVPLIEKACAKLFGSYASLSGGSTAEGLQLLTGAPCERINLRPMNQMIDFDVIWAKILSACESKLLIGASTSASKMQEHEYELVGLNPNHAFTVLAAKSLSVGEGRYLLLRDPHGTTKYTEDSISPPVRKQLSSTRTETPNSSGIFWIVWSNFLRFFDSITVSTYANNQFDIREQAQFTQSATEPVPAYYFVLSKTSLITVSLIYHRHFRKGNYTHTQSFVICNVEENTGDVGTKLVILESSRGTFCYWSGSLKPGAYVIIPFSTSFWKTSSYRKNERTRDYTLVIHSTVQLNGTFIKEPPTLLADAIITATVQYCETPRMSNSSIIYHTPRRFDANLIVVENQFVNRYLTFTMTMTDAENIRHSRDAIYTIDCIPPRHRQLICILEWAQKRGEMANMSYSISQTVSNGWHHAQPPIVIDQNDLHSPRAF